MFFKSKNSASELSNKKVISFLNQKGGVGKTTMCFNTAHALSNKGKRVLCIDFDPQANLSLLFKACDGPNINSLLINSVRELKALHTPILLDDVLVHTDSGVDLIPSGQDLSGFELTMAAINSPRQLILNRFLDKNGVLDRYDFILIDCPPTLGLLVVNAICASQGVIVPFRPDDFSKRGLEHFYEMLEDIKDMGVVEAPEVILHIPNLMDTRRKQEESDLQAIEELITQRLGDNKSVSPIFNKAQIVKAQSLKKSVYEFKGQEFSQIHQQFNQIADMIESWNQRI